MRAKTQKRENEYFDNNLKDPNRIYEILETLFQMSSWSEKYIYMIALTEDDDIQGVFEILHGEENAFSIYPEKDLSQSLLHGVSDVMLVQNHPDGSAIPSEEDLLITEKMNEICKNRGICLFDHVIIANGYYSFRENNVI